VTNRRVTRLAVFATHPVPYQAPIWRALTGFDDLGVTVFFLSDHGVRPSLDPGFSQAFAWDVPLLEGYEHRFLEPVVPLAPRRRLRIRHPRRLLKEGDYDWVMLPGYALPYEIQILAVARSCGARVLMRGEFTDSRPGGRLKEIARRAFLRWAYGRVALFGVIGTAAREHLLGAGISPVRMFDSPYCVDVASLEAQRRQYSREERRRALGLPPATVTFILSGKLTAHKAPDLVADALEQMGSTSHVALIVMGDGPLRPSLEARLRPRLGDRLVMTGFVNQSGLGAYYAAADLLVMPSRSETWGLVVNEAMQFGLPAIVSSAVGCQPDLVEQGVTGFVFPAGDATALAAALGWAGSDRDRVRAMGENARCLIQKYTPQAAALGIRSALGLSPTPAPSSSPR
jgi:glycosyltransferase involved in cell wall biosynthesis